MTERRIIEVIGWLLISLGGLIVVFRRVAGIDLTEGRLLVQDWPWWVTAVACLLGGFCIHRKAANANVEVRADES